MLLSHSDTCHRAVELDRLFRDPLALLDVLKSQGATKFTAIKIHIEFARDACDLMNTGKEYEAACRKFLTLTRRCETLDMIESRLVLVLATDRAEYFKDHPQYACGAYSSPLIEVISLDPTPEVVRVGDRPEMGRLDPTAPNHSREGYLSYEIETKRMFVLPGPKKSGRYNLHVPSLPQYQPRGSLDNSTCCEGVHGLLQMAFWR
jgi:hypothetical protein